MIKFVCKKISQKILLNQDKKNINFFKNINNNKNKLIVMDVGGAGGMQSRWIIFKDYIRSILVEPDERSYIELKNKGLEVIDKALWSEPGNKKFYLTKKLFVSSLFKPNRKFLDLFPDSSRYDILDEINIDVTKIDNVVNQSNQPHFIKLDIQGAELDVLRGGIKTLENVIGLEVEVNFKQIYEKIPLSSDVEKFLESQGFVLNDYLTFFRWERSELRGFGEIIHSDALFLRTPEKIIEFYKKTKSFSIIENYIKILFAYNKLDLIIKISEFLTEEEKNNLNLKNIITHLEKKHMRLKYFGNIIAFFNRYLIQRNLEFPYWKL